MKLEQRDLGEINLLLRRNSPLDKSKSDNMLLLKELESINLDVWIEIMRMFPAKVPSGRGMI